MKAGPRLTALIAVAALFALSMVAVPAAGAAGPHAQASKGCSVNSGFKKLGPTYTLKLSVRGATCAGGRKLVKAWDKCRRSRGGYGKSCPHVSHYTCSERRYNKLSKPYKQYQSDVKCKRGSKRVNFTVKIFKGG
jgi:hypothetical protein